jgi:recombinational DNA repair protein RecR
MEFSSKLIEKLTEISQLPGIGREALRLVLHLLKQQRANWFCQALVNMQKILSIVQLS